MTTIGIGFADDALPAEAIGEPAYLGLLRRILERGERRTDRTGTGTLSIFGAQMRFDLRDGFPLLTTKRVPFAPIVRELLWFLRGSTNIHDGLHEHTKIWDAWADVDGDLGPIYGHQFRNWGGHHVPGPAGAEPWGGDGFHRLGDPEFLRLRKDVADRVEASAGRSDLRGDPDRGALDRSPFVPSVAELMNDDDRGVAVTYLVRSRWCDSEEIAARSPEIAAEKFAIMRWRSPDPIDMLALVEVEAGSRSWLVRVSSAPMPRVDARILWSSAASSTGVS